MTQVQMTFRGMAPSEAVTAHATDTVAKMAQHAKVTGAHVVIESRGVTRPMFTAHVQLFVSGSDIVASHSLRQGRAHASIWVAVDHAFSAAKRQLDDHHDRRVTRKQRWAAGENV